MTPTSTAPRSTIIGATRFGVVKTRASALGRNGGTAQPADQAPELDPEQRDRPEERDRGEHARTRGHNQDPFTKSGTRHQPDKKQIQGGEQDGEDEVFDAHPR